MTIDQIESELRAYRKEIKYRGTHKETSDVYKMYWQGYFDALSYALQELDTVDECHCHLQEPCEWCKDYDLNVCGYVQHGGQVMDAFNWSYCPNCGRKLEESS